VGRHSRPSRIRIPPATTVAAAPTLASVALCLSPQTGLSPSAGLSASAPAAAAQPAAPELRAGPGDVVHAVLTAAMHARMYRVRNGDSLSSIARRFYHDPADWPVLYWHNRHKIRWADEIYAGEVLRVPRKPARAPAPPAALRPVSRDGRRRGRHRKPEHHHHGRTHHSHRRSSEDYYAGPVPGGAFGRCVVWRESSRRPQVMNSTHHYGLYQFSEATWVEYGGKRSEFGHATVAEQNRVFATALRRHGQYNWIPYDHC
jgi:LysM repeat protein